MRMSMASDMLLGYVPGLHVVGGSFEKAWVSLEALGEKSTRGGGGHIPETKYGDLRHRTM
jgi:hypothetical protein